MAFDPESRRVKVLMQGRKGLQLLREDRLALVIASGELGGVVQVKERGSIVAIGMESG